MKYQTAFTLIELMTVVALIMILTMYAIPNMQAMLANNRIVSKTNQLIHAVNYARSEAITDSRRTIQIRHFLEKSWTDGWEVVSVDPVNNTDTTLKVFEFNNDKIEVKNSINLPRFNYTSNGYLVNEIIFKICNSSYPATARQIIIKRTGRPKIETKIDTGVDYCNH